MKTFILIGMLVFISFFKIQAQWKLTGNYNTHPRYNWVGTNDDMPLNFRINKEQAGTLERYRANTALGYMAFKAGTYGKNTGNIWNTAFGAWALENNKISNYNTAIGARALQSNLDGYGNTAVGFSSLGLGSTGYGNTAIGYHALDATLSNYNTAIGFESMSYNLQGYENVAVGFWALLGRTHNIQDDRRVGNTGCGDNALQNIDNQLYNSAFGHDAIYGDSLHGTGSYNSANGTLSLFRNYGNENAALGYSAGYYNTAGNQNLFLGSGADVTSGTIVSYATAIGAYSIVNASNKIQLGNQNDIILTSNGYTVVSDGRFKEDIKEKDVPGLNFINKLRPVTYTFNYKKYDDFLRKNNYTNTTDKVYQTALIEKSKTRQAGFIAQDVDRLVKDSGIVFNGVYEPQTGRDNYALDYSRFVVPLVRAVQQLSTQNDSLKENNKELNDKLKQISDKLDQIENNLNQCCNYSMQQFNADANTSRRPYLNQNIPNPSKGITSIDFFIPSSTHSAELLITNISGEVLKTYTINQSGKGNQIIQTNELADGLYIYSLLIDGKVFDTKKMSIQN